MSGYVYPSSLRGLAWPVVRHTLWHTIVNTSMAMRVATLQLQQYALYQWELMYDVLRDDVTPSELRQITGLFAQVQGQADSFLFTDPTYNIVVNEPMGTGDGITKNFQIIAAFKNFSGAGRADVIQEFNGAPAVLVNNVFQPYVLGPQGLVQFAGVPAIGASITWTGSFYFRCRFLDDSLPLSEFVSRWWQTTRPIKFGSILVV